MLTLISFFPPSHKETGYLQLGTLTFIFWVVLRDVTARPDWLVAQSGSASSASAAAAKQNKASCDWWVSRNTSDSVSGFLEIMTARDSFRKPFPPAWNSRLVSRAPVSLSSRVYEAHVCVYVCCYVTRTARTAAQPASMFFTCGGTTSCFQPPLHTHTVNNGDAASVEATDQAVKRDPEARWSAGNGNNNTPPPALCQSAVPLACSGHTQCNHTPRTQRGFHHFFFIFYFYHIKPPVVLRRRSLPHIERE